MRGFFSNTVIVAILVFVFVCLGGGVGWLLGDLPNNTRHGLTYGFVAFSILPITLCLFGVKELNSVFPSIAMNLTKIERNRLSNDLDKRIVRVIFLAFFLVALQIVFSFFLLYFSTGYEYVILGVLFGGIFGSLTYGIYVCFSVRRLGEFCEQVMSKKAAEERLKKYEESLK